MAKVEVNQNKCIGCGSCEEICPKTFKLKNGKSTVRRAEVKDISCEKKAAEMCPVGAITVTD